MNPEKPCVRRLNGLSRIKQRIARLSLLIYKSIKQVIRKTDVREICVDLRHLRIRSVFER